jgi:hypothetical protein
MLSPRNRKRSAYKRRSKNRKPTDAHTVASFCESNAISLSKYFNLKRDGKGPREIELGGRIIISREAETDWRHEREAETTAKRQREREAAGTHITVTDTA